MFLRGSFSFVFFLAINVDRPEQYAELLRNLQALYRRSCQEQELVRAFRTNSALYAKPANALSSKVFSEVVDLASGDVVQLVRTLPSHSISRISLIFSIICSVATQSALSPSRLCPSLFSLRILILSTKYPHYYQLFSGRCGFRHSNQLQSDPFHLPPKRLALRQR